MHPNAKPSSICSRKGYADGKDVSALLIDPKCHYACAANGSACFNLANALPPALYTVAHPRIEKEAIGRPPWLERCESLLDIGRLILQTCRIRKQCESLWSGCSTRAAMEGELSS